MTDMIQIIRSGYVTRYHSNPDIPAETNGQHQCAVGQIICAFNPNPSQALLYAALHHDAGELIVGDMPGPFKWRFPDLAAQHAEAEAHARDTMGIRRFDLNEADNLWLKWADSLAAYLHAWQTARAYLDSNGWPEHRASIISRSWALGIGAEAMALMDELQ
jgi:5'-deoxynucleotidase